MAQVTLIDVMDGLDPQAALSRRVRSAVEQMQLSRGALAQLLDAEGGAMTPADHALASKEVRRDASKIVFDAGASTDLVQTLVASLSALTTAHALVDSVPAPGGPTPGPDAGPTPFAPPPTPGAGEAGVNQAAVAVLEDALARERQRRAELEDRVAQLRGELRTARRTPPAPVAPTPPTSSTPSTPASRELAEVRRQLETLQFQLDESAVGNDDLQQQLNRVVGVNAALQQQLDESGAANAALQLRLADASTRIDEESQDAESARAAHDRVQEANNLLQTDLDDARTTLRQREAQHAAALAAASGNNTEALTQQISELQANLVAAREALAESRRTQSEEQAMFRDEMQARVDQANARRLAFAERVSENMALMRRLIDSSALVAPSGSSQSPESAAARALANVGERLSAIQARVKALVRSSPEGERTPLDLATLVDQASAEFQSLSTAQGELQAENDELRRQVEALNLAQTMPNAPTNPPTNPPTGPGGSTSGSTRGSTSGSTSGGDGGSASGSTSGGDGGSASGSTSGSTSGRDGLPSPSPTPTSSGEGGDEQGVDLSAQLDELRSQVDALSRALGAARDTNAAQTDRIEELELELSIASAAADAAAERAEEAPASPAGRVDEDAALYAGYLNRIKAQLSAFQSKFASAAASYTKLKSIANTVATRATVLEEHVSALQRDIQGRDARMAAYAQILADYDRRGPVRSERSSAASPYPPPPSTDPSSSGASRSLPSAVGSDGSAGGGFDFGGGDVGSFGGGSFGGDGDVGSFGGGGPTPPGHLGALKAEVGDKLTELAGLMGCNGLPGANIFDGFHPSGYPIDWLPAFLSKAKTVVDTCSRGNSACCATAASVKKFIGNLAIIHPYLSNPRFGASDLLPQPGTVYEMTPNDAEGLCMNIGISENCGSGDKAALPRQLLRIFTLKNKSGSAFRAARGVAMETESHVIRTGIDALDELVVEAFQTDSDQREYLIEQIQAAAGPCGEGTAWADFVDRDAVAGALDNLRTHRAARVAALAAGEA